MQEMKKQYEAAVEQIKLAGATVIENDMSCCRSCAMYEMDSVGVTEETKLAWTYGGQGNELFWQGDQPMYRGEEFEEEEVDEGVWEQPEQEESPAEDQHWYHSGGGGAIAARAFRDAGFEVEWDGTETKAVLVKFQ